MLCAVVYWLKFNNSFQNKQKSELQCSLIPSDHQPEMPLNVAAMRASQPAFHHYVLFVHLDTKDVSNLENTDTGKMVKYSYGNEF